jgi:hypothetical protein
MECTGCKQGVSMCHNRPCFGSPEEFDKIIDAGYADKLRIDHWTGAPASTRIKVEDTIGDGPFVDLQKMLYDYQQKNPNPHEEDVEMLSGGTDNDNNYYAPWMPSGTCKLLTEDNKCMLHDSGLKPSQGANACCNSELNTAEDNLYYANLWATPKGKEVIEKFKRTVNIA